MRNLLRNCIITFLKINCVLSQKQISPTHTKNVTKYNKWQIIFVRRFNETKQESVPQKATKHQQALLHVV